MKVVSRGIVLEINEVLEVDGIKIKAVKARNCCEGCLFDKEVDTNDTAHLNCLLFSCSECDREDKTEIILVEVND